MAKKITFARKYRRDTVILLFTSAITSAFAECRLELERLGMEFFLLAPPFWIRLRVCFVYLLIYFDHFYWKLEIDRSILRTQSNINDEGFLQAVNYFCKKSSIVYIHLGFKYISASGICICMFALLNKILAFNDLFCRAPHLDKGNFLKKYFRIW